MFNLPLSLSSPLLSLSLPSLLSPPVSSLLFFFFSLSPLVFTVLFFFNEIDRLLKFKYLNNILLCIIIYFYRTELWQIRSTSGERRWHSRPMEENLTKSKKKMYRKRDILSLFLSFSLSLSLSHSLSVCLSLSLSLCLSLSLSLSLCLSLSISLLFS